MRKSISILFGAAVVFATPAAAANFAGPRAEVRGGWDRMTLDLSYDDGVDSFHDSGHKSGFTLGGEVGYDAALSPTLTAGAYAGAEFATTKSCSEVVGDDKACLKMGRNLTLGARLGAKVSPMALLYVKGGYSNGQLKATYRNDIDPTLDFSDHANRGGFHLGLGAEMAVGSQGYVRAEYVRTNYNGEHYSDGSVDVDLDGHRDQVLLGFGLRF